MGPQDRRVGGARAGGAAQEGQGLPCRASWPRSAAQTDLPAVGCVVDITDGVFLLETGSGASFLRSLCADGGMRPVVQRTRTRTALAHNPRDRVPPSRTGAVGASWSVPRRQRTPVPSRPEARVPCALGSPSGGGQSASIRRQSRGGGRGPGWAGRVRQRLEGGAQARHSDTEPRVWTAAFWKSGGP